MKHLLYILLLTSCATFKTDAIDTIKMSNEGTVIAVNQEYSIFTVRFHCEKDLPRCYRDVHYDLKNFAYIEVGMILILN